MPPVKPPTNLEIEQALKQFQEKSGVAPQSTTTQPIPLSDDRPKMVRLVMKLSGGAIKEERQAEYVLIALTILMLVFSLLPLFVREKPSLPLPQNFNGIDQSQFIR